MEVIEISKRIFGVPDFVYYAVADGIFEIIKTFKSGIGKFFSLPNYNGQLFFVFCFGDFTADFWGNLKKGKYLQILQKML